MIQLYVLIEFSLMLIHISLSLPYYIYAILPFLQQEMTGVSSSKLFILMYLSKQWWIHSPKSAYDPYKSKYFFECWHSISSLTVYRLAANFYCKQLPNYQFFIIVKITDHFAYQKMLQFRKQYLKLLCFGIHIDLFYIKQLYMSALLQTKYQQTNACTT